MKRADITEIFPDASKEQVEKLMALNGADVNAAKAEADDLRQQLSSAPSAVELQQAKEKAAQLQTELDSMKNAETVRLVREKVAGEKKIPVSLLTGETEEACAKQADEILAFAKPGGYPKIRDGGEPHNPPSGGTTRERFAAWAEENL